MRNEERRDTLNQLKRTKTELEKAFRVEIRSLEEIFREAQKLSPLDEMREKKIADMAISLRKLIIDSKNMRSLISLLEIRNVILLPPVCTFSQNDYAGNIVPVYPLVNLRMEKYFYCEAAFYKLKSNLRFHVDDWLGEVVIDPKCEQPFKPTRRDVICVIADKEGGAHYDAIHDRHYYEIVTNFEYEMVDKDGNAIQLKNNVYMETLFSITNEFLQSVNEYFSLLREYKKEYEMNSRFLMIETRYSFLDKGKTLFQSKYVHNDTHNLNTSMGWAFDSNGKASYYLVETKNLFYKNTQTNQLLCYIVLDKANCYDLVYLLDLVGKRSFVITRLGSKYYHINVDSDFFNLRGRTGATLNQMVSYCSNNNPSVFRWAIEHQNLDNKHIILG